MVAAKLRALLPSHLDLLDLVTIFEKCVAECRTAAARIFARTGRDITVMASQEQAESALLRQQSQGRRALREEDQNRRADPQKIVLRTENDQSTFN